MKTFTISSGETSSGIMVYGGDAEYVLSGGTAIATVVHAGGTDVVFTDGDVISTMLSGGTEILSNGTASATLVGAGGIEQVQAGGVAIATSVGHGGNQYVAAGGLTRASVIGRGGFEFVSENGSARSTDVQSGGTLIVLPGGAATNTTVESGGTVLSQGVVILSGFDVISTAARVLTGGALLAGTVEDVMPGGSTVSAVLNGGTQQIFAGGVASAATIEAGQQIVLSGGLAAATLDLGGAIDVLAGGVAEGAILRTGATMFIDAGGFARGTVVSAGGSAFVFSGGAALQTIVSAGGDEFILAEGVVRDSVILSGGLEVVGQFGSAEVTDIQSGGEQYASGGNADGSIVESGGVLLVAIGQTVTGADVQSGGMVVVLPTGQANATVTEHGGQVLSGGVFLLSGARLVSATGSALGAVPVGAGETEYVLQGGLARAGMISGTQYIYSGGTARSASVLSGGAEIAFSGGLVSASTIGSGGLLEVSFAATATGAAVANGGQVEVLDGTVIGTMIGSGGVQFVEAGIEQGTTVLAGGLDVLRGTGSATTIMSGGEQVVAHGVASNTVIGSGAYLLLSTGGIAQGAQVQSGGVVILLPGATATDTTLHSGGHVQSTGVVVLSGFAVVQNTPSTLAGAVVSAAETEYVLSHGTAMGNFIYGTQQVASGGAARGNTVFGTSFILSGGAAHNDTVSGGALFVASHAIAVGTTLTAFGGLTVSAGGTASSTFVGSGTIETIMAGGTASGAVIVSGGTEQVELGASEIGATLLSGGVLDLQAFGFISGGTASINTKTDILTVSAGGLTERLQLAGDYKGVFFHVSGGFGATITVDGTPCYCRGTRILTDAGEVAVEDLRIGDRLVTASGDARPLRWIGQRAYAGAFAAGNPDVLPVLFRAGSLGDSVPRRDLHVSPLHAMYLDGVLVPANCLTNGTTIVQAAGVDEVSYFHLELDSHDIILAEGAPSETYLDDANRGMFHNVAEYRALYPDVAQPLIKYCADRVEHGDALEAIRRRLFAAPAPAFPALDGWLDVAQPGRIAGWAADHGSPAAPVRLRLIADGITLTELVADLPRHDVAPDARCGFDFTIPGGLDPHCAHLIEVRRVEDGAILPNSPLTLSPQDSAAAVLAPPHGNIDRADRAEVLGWIHDDAGPVAVQILDNGVYIGRALANRHRVDIAAAGLGNGRCAFAFAFPGGLSPAIRHTIEVRRDRDGAPLPGSPVTILPADSFDAALQRAVTQAIDAVDPDAREHVLQFLMQQAERLRKG